MNLDDAAIRSAAARADLCRYLAACFYEPAQEFGEERLFDSIERAAIEAAPELAEGARALAAAFDAQSLESLLVDYTRLFLGPVEALARPYESAWLDTPVAGPDRIGAVTRAYEEAGFEIDEGFRDLPDHVAAELEFVYLLIVREAAARASGDSAALQGALEAKRRFLAAHLGAWIGPFADALGAGARSDFYRSLARIAGRFVALEAERSRRPDA